MGIVVQAIMGMVVVALELYEMVVVYGEECMVEHMVHVVAVMWTMLVVQVQDGDNMGVVLDMVVVVVVVSYIGGAQMSMLVLVVREDVHNVVVAAVVVVHIVLDGVGMRVVWCAV